MYTGTVKIDRDGFEPLHFVSQQHLNNIIAYLRIVYAPEYYTITPSERTHKEAEAECHTPGRLARFRRFFDGGDLLIRTDYPFRYVV